jgi:hypothetical protein
LTNATKFVLFFSLAVMLDGCCKGFTHAAQNQPGCPTCTQEFCSRSVVTAAANRADAVRQKAVHNAVSNLVPVRQDGNSCPSGVCLRRPVDSATVLVDDGAVSDGRRNAAAVTHPRLHLRQPRSSSPCRRRWGVCNRPIVFRVERSHRTRRAKVQANANVPSGTPLECK